MTILVPTDFSDCAYNALNYAIKLASDLNAEILVMHSIQYKESAFIPPQPDNNDNKEIYNEARQNLNNSLKYIRSQNTQVKIREILDAGPAELSISAVFDKEKIDYVVMGTEGSSGLKAVIYGSFTSNVLLISPCPVFTIPLTAQYTGFKNIICATEMAESETHAIKETLAFAKKFNAEVTFYNVDSDKKEQALILNKFKEKISTISDHSKIKFELTESNDIAGAIDNYVCNVDTDLLITLGKKKDLLESLFRKKITKKLCMHTKIPLLAFPNFKEEKQQRA